MANLCDHGIECDPTVAWKPGTCARCWAKANPDRVKKPAAVVSVHRSAPPVPVCRHLGAPTGEQRILLHCQADPPNTVAVRSCAKHGTCTENAVARATQCCRFCADRQPVPTAAPPAVPDRSQLISAPVRRRHLVYHLLPVKDRWPEAIAELRQRWSLFDGKKIIAVITGGILPPAQGYQPKTPLLLDPPDSVRKHLPADCEVIELPNDPSRWELVSWPHLWNKILAVAHPDDAIFYAHGKSLTRPLAMWETTREWARMLYALNLDHWKAVEGLLSTHPVAGALLKPGRFFGDHSIIGQEMSRSEWHYSGNFWWVRAGQMRWPAVNVPLDRWGSEAWIGIAYKQHEAGCLFGNNEMGVDVYHADTWNKTLLPNYSKWLVDNPPDLKFVPSAIEPKLSVIVATSGRRSIDRTLTSITTQLKEGDELIVRSDATGDWGASPRTLAIRQAMGTHLMFMDDDDFYLPGAFDTVRHAIKNAPGKPLIFRMIRGGGINDVLWREEKLVVGNVSTQMFVCPNDPDKIGVWGTRYEGDYDFIASTVARYPDRSLVWRPEVISIWRPD